MNKRDAYWDNAKFGLITLVVFGHLIEPMISKDVGMTNLFHFIYLFHMPAFIFISGYFTKGRMTASRLLRLTLDYLVLFLLVQTLFVAVTKWMGITQYAFWTLQPAYIYWYLFAVFIWTLVLWGIVWINHFLQVSLWYFVAGSIMVSVYLGFFETIGWTLSASRIIVFFPFFLLGYTFRRHKLTFPTSGGAKVFGLGVGGIAIVLLLRYPETLNFQLLSGTSGYASMGLSLEGAGIRLSLYALQLLLVCAFFAWIPRRYGIGTTLGAHTLPIYVGHGFIVKAMIAASFYDNVESWHLVWVGMTTILILVLLGNLPMTLQLSKWIKVDSEQKNAYKTERSDKLSG